MELLKRYINLHILAINYLVSRVISSTSGGLFASLFNLRSIILFRAVRVHLDGEDYVASDPGFPGRSCRFRHEKQGDMAYQKGLVFRATSLARAYFLDRIEFSDGDVIMDCGANVGDIKLWFDLNKVAVNYIGFEPSPKEFACLKKNVEPQVAHNVGLWKEAGSLTFFVSSQGADSSLIEPASYDERIEVETRTLDTFIDQDIKLLKLEAEGAEPEILEGAGDAIQRVQYITADLGPERGVSSESTLAPVTNFLLNRGFELVEVSHDRVCALYRNTQFGR